MKYLYKYPQTEFPYEDLIKENARRGKQDQEYQIIDTGVFDEDRYWDIIIETAKEDDNPDELLFRVTAWNRGPDPAPIHIIPHVWFRNTWAWGREKPENKPSISAFAETSAKSTHPSLGERYVVLSPSPGVGPSGEDVLPEVVFTDNDTNFESLYDGENQSKYVKDGFHRYIVNGEKEAVNPAQTGTKCAGWYAFNESGGVAPGECAGMVTSRPMGGTRDILTASLQLCGSNSPRNPRRSSTKRSLMISLKRRRTRPTSSTTGSAPFPWLTTSETSSGRHLLA